MLTQIKPELTQRQADEERLILESVSVDEVVGAEPGPAVSTSVLLEEIDSTRIFTTALTNTPVQLRSRR